MARIILYIVLERIVFYQADFVTSTDIVCTKAPYQQQQRVLRVTIKLPYPSSCKKSPLFSANNKLSLRYAPTWEKL